MERFSKKRVATIGLTFAVALGAGFLVQYGDAVASRWGVESPVTGPNARETLDEITLVPVAASIAAPNALSTPTITAPTEASVSIDIPLEEEIAPTFVPAPVESEEVLAEEEPAVAEADCGMTLSAVEMKLAMVQLELTAPCNPSQVVAIHHEDLMFNAKTDENGSLVVDVPALSTDAFFIAAFDGGFGAIAQTDVPEFANFDRAVLQWQGDMGVELHALEFGATYGEDGHRWSQSLGNFAGTVIGQSGIVTQLGDKSILMPMLAEVYTFPSGFSSEDGVVALSVEASVMNMNCGQPISAQTIQIRPAQEALVSSVAMTMPNCDAIGEYVVLKNVLEDLTLASK